MWLILLLDGYRSVDLIFLLLLTKGQGHVLINFVDICVSFFVLTFYSAMRNSADDLHEVTNLIF